MKSKYYVFTAKRGSTDKKKEFFDTYEEARKFVKVHHPDGNPKSIYHIYPTNPVYYSKSDGTRKSFGLGNKEWEKNQRKK
jgi:hypothetical protein